MDRWPMTRRCDSCLGAWTARVVELKSNNDGPEVRSSRGSRLYLLEL
jgi:hypothetical protein